jgi:acetyl-CoA acetyltransferase
LPVTTPALTVNRVCGSGAQAIVSAAQEIALGNIDVAVAGGAPAGAIAWATASFMTAFCATA